MTRRTSRGALWLAVLLLTGTAGCSSVGLVTDPGAVARMTAELRPGKTTASEVKQLMGSPSTRTIFKPGHQVWHYYQPANGMSWLSAVPVSELMSTERGRPATDIVLLFSVDLVLRQVLVRELPRDFADASKP